MEPHTPPETPVQPTQKNTTSISLPAAIVTGAVIIGLAIILAFSPTTTPKNDPLVQESGEITSVPADVAVVRPSDRIRGDANTAEIAVIEYVDTDCSFCARFHTTMQQVYSDYKGRVVWVTRHYPLSGIHPNATTEAVALECVAELGGNAAFNTYLDTIINVTLNPDPKSNQQLTNFATSQGIDAKLFKSCTEGTAASDRVAADAAEAEKIGARGTPFNIIVNLKSGEQKIIPGAYPIEEIKKNIDSLLK